MASQRRVSVSRRRSAASTGCLLASFLVRSGPGGLELCRCRRPLHVQPGDPHQVVGRRRKLRPELVPRLADEAQFSSPAPRLHPAEDLLHPLPPPLALPIAAVAGHPPIHRTTPAAL